MKYLSVCSGIEAASVAWHPLGWQPVGYSEIEKFPSAVLAHRYPSVPNLGDMTKFKEWPDADVDVLVGGTPCQSFSVAGLRQGLADPRGNLALTFLALADRYRPEWVLWENVPGVLSSDKGRDFGAFLGGLGQLGYGWSYRVLDAQYVRVDGFGRAVPQRRRRVFVVGNLGDWRRAAAVLFERESLQGNPAPRREAGQRASGPIAGCSNDGGANGPGRTADDADSLIPVVASTSRPTGGGGLGADFDCGGLVPTVANPLTARMHKGINTTMDEGQTMVAHSLRHYGADSGDTAPTLRAMGHNGSHANAGGQVAVAFAQNTRNEVVESDVALSLKAGGGKPGQGYPAGRQGWAVRRLTPVECERLQGFPDNWTNIPWRGKNGAPDGPRYRALGNSMAVNCMRWLGRRIDLVNRVEKHPERVRFRREVEYGMRIASR